MTPAERDLLMAVTAALCAMLAQRKLVHRDDPSIDDATLDLQTAMESFLAERRPANPDT